MRIFLKYQLDVRTQLHMDSYQNNVSSYQYAWCRLRWFRYNETQIQFTDSLVQIVDIFVFHVISVMKHVNAMDYYL